MRDFKSSSSLLNNLVRIETGVNIPKKSKPNTKGETTIASSRPNLIQDIFRKCKMLGFKSAEIKKNVESDEKISNQTYTPENAKYIAKRKKTPEKKNPNVLSEGSSMSDFSIGILWICSVTHVTHVTRYYQTSLIDETKNYIYELLTDTFCQKKY